MFIIFGSLDLVEVKFYLLCKLTNRGGWKVVQKCENWRQREGILWVVKNSKTDDGKQIGSFYAFKSSSKTFFK